MSVKTTLSSLFVAGVALKFRVLKGKSRSIKRQITRISILVFCGMFFLGFLAGFVCCLYGWIAVGIMFGVGVVVSLAYYLDRFLERRKLNKEILKFEQERANRKAQRAMNNDVYVHNSWDSLKKSPTRRLRLRFVTVPHLKSEGFQTPRSTHEDRRGN